MGVIILQKQAKDDAFWMQQALEQAQLAAACDEVPVGAVLIDSSGELIASGHNQPIAAHDPTAHAEIMVLREAAKLQHNYRLPETTLYVTLEPCPMCAAAISNARLARLYYGASDPKSGGVAQGPRVFSHAQCHHAPEVYDGLSASASEDLLKSFFAQKRGG